MIFHAALRNYFRRLVLPALLLSAVSLGHAKGRKPPEISFTIDPSTVTAGRTLTVWCVSDRPLKHPAVYFKEQKAFLFPVDKTQWRGFIGISSMEEPGRKEASVYAKLPRDRIYQATVAFVVQAGTYPVSRVRLSREKDSLITTGKLERDAAILRDIYEDPIEYAKLWSGYFVMPTTGIISSVYGARRAYRDRMTYTAHTGTDIANEAGTPIHAPNRGRVVFADWLDSFGHSAMLDHGLGVYSYYLHMKELAVKTGQTVETGELLGLMGAEGLATGPHLHWSFVVSGERVDPLEWTEREFR
jgi:murein DD-endopeptidase MepM/ murein hydrolase activator NlpD